MPLEKLFELGEIYYHLPSVRQQVRFIKINTRNQLPDQARKRAGRVSWIELLCVLLLNHSFFGMAGNATIFPKSL